MTATVRALLISFVASLLAIPSLAQDSARAPLRLLVGFAPGGSSDLAARIIGDKLKEVLGTSVIVDNKAGAGGRIAAEALKNSRPTATRSC